MAYVVDVMSRLHRHHSRQSIGGEAQTAEPSFVRRVALANQAYANSGINPAATALAYAGEVAYNESGDISKGP